MVSYLRPHNRDMRQVTGGNPYGDEISGDISSLIEKVSNTFDGFNRLKQVERIKAGERVTVEYIYDGDDLRTRKTVRSSKDEYAAKVTNYLYDRQYVILETDASNNVAVRYVRGINYIARIDSTDKLSYYLFNGHGDVVQTVNENGEVENNYDYDIFGSPILTVETYANAIRYAGEFYDEEVGLYYLRARYYDPYIGRFISQDSYWGEDDNPLSLNLYTYVHNDPINFWDPTGHIEDGDQDLSLDQQGALLSLTKDYYAAETQEEKDAIHAKAEGIRDGTVNPYQILGNNVSEGTVYGVVSDLMQNSELSDSDKTFLKEQSDFSDFTDSPQVVFNSEYASTTISNLNTALAQDEGVFWTSDKFKGNDWTTHPEVFNVALDALAAEVRFTGGIELNKQTYGNKMLAIQRLINAQENGDYHGGMLAAIDTIAANNNITQYDPTFIDSRILQGAITQYPNIIGRDSSDWLRQRLGFNVGDAFYTALSAVLLARVPGMIPNAAEEEAAAIKVAQEGAGEVKTLFRGDRSSVNPDIAFKEGFTPKGTHDNLEQHVTSNTTAGNFISTTSEKGIAEQFAGKNGYVYEIQTSNYVDVNKTLGAKSPFPEQMEFSIPGGVNPSEIKGAWVMKNGVITDEFIPNPGFTGGQ